MVERKTEIPFEVLVSNEFSVELGFKTDILQGPGIGQIIGLS